jgi:hypothetical protein
VHGPSHDREGHHQRRSPCSPQAERFSDTRTFTDSDERYFQSTIEWVDTVTTALGRPSHVIFQSWWGPAPSGLHEVPINLPDDDPAVHSHTRLINEILDALG